MRLKEYYDEMSYFDIIKDMSITIDASGLGYSDSFDPYLLFEYLGSDIPKTLQEDAYTFLGNLEVCNISLVKKAHPTENESPVGVVLSLLPNDFVYSLIDSYSAHLASKAQNK